MSVQVVSVPVPTSGDGAAVSIANLVGEKSIILTGLFAGQYVILAGHEAGELVPVLQFDAGGEAGVQQTLPEAYQYVAVRAQPNTSPVGTAVTVNVAGVVGAGVEFHPVELADAITGIFFIDFLRHDFGHTRGLDLAISEREAMEDLIGTLSPQEMRARMEGRIIAPPPQPVSSVK